jgi:hypothetical protein
LILRTDNLLAGKLILPFDGEAACHCVVQRRSACGNHSGEAERHSGVGLKLFGFIAESVFAFIPEPCSGSSRNAVRHHPGIAFTLPRIPQETTMRYLVPASDVHDRLDQVIVPRVNNEAGPPRKSIQAAVATVNKTVRRQN